MPKKEEDEQINIERPKSKEEIDAMKNTLWDALTDGLFEKLDDLMSKYFSKKNKA